MTKPNTQRHRDAVYNRMVKALQAYVEVLIIDLADPTFKGREDQVFLKSELRATQKRLVNLGAWERAPQGNYAVDNKLYRDT